MVNVALILLLFLPFMILCLILVTLIILGVIAAEGIMHYMEAKNDLQSAEQ
jgi:predicted DNA repair protein MutK